MDRTGSCWNADGGNDGFVLEEVSATEYGHVGTVQPSGEEEQACNTWGVAASSAVRDLRSADNRLLRDAAFERERAPQADRQREHGLKPEEQEERAGNQEGPGNRKRRGEPSRITREPLGGRPTDTRPANGGSTENRKSRGEENHQAEVQGNRLYRRANRETGSQLRRKSEGDAIVDKTHYRPEPSSRERDPVFNLPVGTVVRLTREEGYAVVVSDQPNMHIVPIQTEPDSEPRHVRRTAVEIAAFPVSRCTGNVDAGFARLRHEAATA